MSFLGWLDISINCSLVLEGCKVLVKVILLLSKDLSYPDEGPRQSPLAMLMEAMEKEPSREPEGTTTGIGPDDTQSGDWLVVMYEQNWWLAKALTIDPEHQDVQHKCRNLEPVSKSTHIRVNYTYILYNIFILYNF
ncbi:hypothetical protein Q7C36_022860 [Tachysurus vachellii]|uniref:Uncharacterized protein n=1 Tax=Tachysurus vachellii TaxID=175792 RepID=A0AA88J4H6_TACVA|nr:hypothetical protein Q7C36_022860 [Tachysurus vachellii]